MENAVKRIIDRIESDFRELAKLAEATHISAFIIDGAFSIQDYTDLDNRKFDEYRTGENNE